MPSISQSILFILSPLHRNITANFARQNGRKMYTFFCVIIVPLQGLIEIPRHLDAPPQNPGACRSHNVGNYEAFSAVMVAEICRKCSIATCRERQFTYILFLCRVPVMKRCHAVSILSALLFHLWNNQGKGAVAGGEGARRSWVSGRPTFLKLMKKNEDGSHRWQR